MQRLFQLNNSPSENSTHEQSVRLNNAVKSGYIHTRTHTPVSLATWGLCLQPGQQRQTVKTKHMCMSGGCERKERRGGEVAFSRSQVAL